MWWEQEEDYAGVMSNETTFVELVLDFELFKRQRVEDEKMGGSITWLRKAAVFANMYKAALKYTKGPLVKERIPATRVQVMLPFGVPGKFKGIGKRPRFLMSEKTEEFFARNALALGKLIAYERRSYEVNI